MGQAVEGERAAGRAAASAIVQQAYRPRVALKLRTACSMENWRCTRDSTGSAHVHTARGGVARREFASVPHMVCR